MQRVRLKRSVLCEKLREVAGIADQKSHLENFVLGSVPTDDSVRTAAKKEVTDFCSQYRTKMQKCSSNFELLKSRFSVWYNNDIVINVNRESSAKQKVGRPATNFDDSKSDRTKRLKTSHIRENNSAACLLSAASMRFRTEGNEACAKLLKIISDRPDRVEELLKFCNENGYPEKPVKLSGEEALSVLLDADLGKSQYQIVRTIAKSHKADIFPPYLSVTEAKKSVFPMEHIIVTESSSEVKLQDLLNYDAKRVVHLLEKSNPGFVNDIQDGERVEFYHKWGVDGSGDHSRYNQSFSNSPSADDSRVLLTAMSPLQLVCVKPGLPFQILWKNPTPSSVRFCKPIRIQFLKETDESLKAEECYITQQIKTAQPTTVTTTCGKTIIIEHKLSMTMIDGKTRKVLTNTASYARCPACDALPNQMKVATTVSRPVDTNTFQYGLSVLHARIRFLELVLHISYKIEIQQWSANEALFSERRERIINGLRAEVGILVDTVKQGSGSTNDGNTARRFFANPSVVSAVTGFNEGLLRRFAVVLDTLSCGYEIDIDKFRVFCLETAKEFDVLYPWYKMPSAVHLILIHGADIMERFDLPIGDYSEEALEARNKDIRAFREHKTRKVSRTATMFDLFYRLLLTGDIFLSSSRLRRSRDRETVPENIAFLLK